MERGVAETRAGRGPHAGGPGVYGFAAGSAPPPPVQAWEHPEAPSIGLGYASTMAGRPHAVLMCPPDDFDVVDARNAFMADSLAAGLVVDHALAVTEWDILATSFEAAGYPVEHLPPTAGCADMVFTANPSLPGRHRDGHRVCVLSHMKHPSRRPEVAAHARWFAGHGYDVIDLLPPDLSFEGCGDALWHPGRHLLWIGAGPRTSQAAHRLVADAFDARVRSLELVDPRFYHLDTCLCLLDERRALLHPPAFAPAGRAELQRNFDQLLAADPQEAIAGFACNATALPDGTVLIDQCAPRTAAQLDRMGLRVVTVDTGEFLKSGGSVFCMKQFVY